MAKFNPFEAEIGNLFFETYQGTDGQFYWRVKSVKNGKTLADGAEGYRSHANVKRALRAFLETFNSNK